MAAITIGLPVYNEGELLRGSLETLARQTFTDFEVLIYDNASTDNTGEVAQSFASRDPRFHYFRQSENKGALPNFYDCLLAAKAEYFLWRAADDRSDDNYLEVLHGLLEGDTSKSLAVGIVQSAMLDGKIKRIVRNFPDQTRNSLTVIFKLLRSSHASWIYGLFRRERLTDVMHKIIQQYPNSWAFDHLVLFPYLIDNSVATSSETTFYQVIKRLSTDKASPTRWPISATEMIHLRQQFSKIAKQFICDSSLNAFRKAAIRILLPLHTSKRVAKLRKIIWQKILFS